MHTSRKTDAYGIFLMILSMAAFAIADTLVKVAAATVSPPQVMFLLLGGGLVMFFAMAWLQGENLLDRRAFSPFLLLRSLAELVGIMGMVLALTYVPLSTVGAIVQASPLMVALGAVLFLGEKVSWRRWSAIGLGFVGVLLVIQPGTEGFNLAALWAVLSAVGMSVRDLLTRMVPPDMGSSSLATFTMVATTPFPLAWIMLEGNGLFPADANWLMLLAMVTSGSVGYLLLIASIRAADVSLVIPYRYSRLIFLVVLGVLVFDERPGTLMLVGAAIIVLSGLYMMWREQVVKNKA